MMWMKRQPGTNSSIRSMNWTWRGVFSIHTRQPAALVVESMNARNRSTQVRRRQGQPGTSAAPVASPAFSRNRTRCPRAAGEARPVNRSRKFLGRSRVKKWDSGKVSTSGWLPRMLCSRVVPDRGQPTTKTRPGDSVSLPFTCHRRPSMCRGPPAPTTWRRSGHGCAPP